MPPWAPLPQFAAELVPQPLSTWPPPLPPIGAALQPVVVLAGLFDPAPAVPLGWYPVPAEPLRWDVSYPPARGPEAGLLVAGLHVNDVHPGKWYSPPAEMWPPLPDITLRPSAPLAWLQALFVPVPVGWWPAPPRVIEWPDVAAVYQIAAYPLPVLAPRFGPQGGDGARWYLTGAGSDGGAQAAAAASLGSYRSSTEASRIGVEPVIGAAGLTLEQVAGANYRTPDIDVAPMEALAGTVDVTGANTVRYTGPGGLPGAEVSVEPGKSVTVADDSGSRWVRVARSGSSALRGQVIAVYVDQLHNVFGMSDALEAESAAGGNRYRAVMLRSAAYAKLVDVRAYVGVLGAAVTPTAVLGGAGGGTITFAADALLAWPLSGWARIATSAGVLREIVYYSSRTHAVLTVPAGGRSRLGTTAAAGAVTDSVVPVPGIRIGWETTVGRNQPVQAVANESTAPTGVTWSTGVTPSTGVALGDLDFAEHAGLWLHREIPAGAAATPRLRNLVRCQYTIDGVSYTEDLAGLYGIQDDQLARFELVISSSVPALEAAANETFTALPYTTTLTLAAGNYWYRVRRRNKWGMLAEPVNAVPLRVVSSGGGVGGGLVAPSGPSYVSWVAAAGGTFRLRAQYQSFADSSPADQWLVYLRTNGTNPDPTVDTPTVVTMTEAGLGLVWLDVSYGPYSAGTDGRVLLRTRRSSDTTDSTNTAVYAAVASGTGPSAVTGKVFWPRVAEQS